MPFAVLSIYETWYYFIQKENGGIYISQARLYFTFL